METVAIPDRSWNDVQSRVRSYAEGKDLDVSSTNYLSLENARVGGLMLYRKGALVPVVTFRPFFQPDGRTLKHVNAEYKSGRGVEDLLRELGTSI